ncbi:MAG: sodium:calcium antiporter, partial [Leptolyngbya sp. SIO4C1]|nr:sodium:calcium antiporter [Leptolyngbya sp. SIO4C1]
EGLGFSGVLFRSEAMMGALFLGGSTSLPGIITSVTAAWNGYPELAISNAVGGIAAQTVFLAVADICYRRANLEHAAASIANLIQGTLLTTLLLIPILAYAGPDISFWGVHPATPVLFFAYCFGLRMVSTVQSRPMWEPRKTKDTTFDQPEQDLSQTSLTKLWSQFAIYALIVAVCGYLIGQSGIAIASQTSLSESLVGTLLTAVSTSLPELVTTIAAVRNGALMLAVGGIIGGNCFDLLFMAFADVAYRPGSIYSAISAQQLFSIALTALMTGVLILGLLRRQQYGFANIGFESVLILGLYLSGVVILFLG